MDQAAIESNPLPGTGAPIDWKLASIDVTNGCLFMLGLLAMVIGAVWVGLAAWAVCLWLDWRTLAYLQTETVSSLRPTLRGRLDWYIHFRTSSAVCAHVVGALVGLFLAVGGRWTPALVVWLLIAAGTVPRRRLGRLGSPGSG